MKYNTVLPLAQGTVRFANVVIYIRRDGKIVVRQRYNDAGKGIRTPERLAGWVRWANVLNQYKTMVGLMRSMFPDREHFRSAFGEFMSLNVPRAEVCLTKWDARLGAVVFQPGLIVSMGNTLEMPSIEVELVGNDLMVSDIRVDPDFEITEQTTIAQLTGQVVNHNKLTFFEGDTLFFLRCTQTFNSVLDIPQGTSRWFRCDLDLKDDRKVREVVGTDGFQTTLRDGKRYLSAYADTDSMGAWLHGHRKSDGRWITTLQTLVGRNSRLPDYSSAEAEKKAGDSYGGPNRFNYLNSKTQVLTWEEIEGSGVRPGGGTGPGPGSDPTTPTPTPVTKVTVSVVITGENASRGSVSPETVTVDKGTPVTFTATVDTGYKPKWPNNSNALSYTVTPTESMNIALQFIADSGLSVKESE